MKADMYMEVDSNDDLFDVIDLTLGDDEAVDDMEFSQWPPIMEKICNEQLQEVAIHLLDLGAIACHSTIQAPRHNVVDYPPFAAMDPPTRAVVDPPSFNLHLGLSQLPFV